VTPYKFSGRLLDFEVKDPHLCARLRGWLHGVVELTGCLWRSREQPQHSWTADG
jgi:hypothetical protein